ncbi:GNAT family N-acetyltransferase [Halomonas denitrificans]|uniref:GNAT family N-acetyltransferase n=1 Tax=Halomonas TaxID=2745 RepID=UPI001C9484C6|nr:MULTISPECIES: GNAT family N-acetyltransferase [Halomonas]MED5294626.1 GNAT family N-acetyltransferase [Pseudomonadota bacterium]MBY5929004.1 GNAT family N-acetyltransferase [Halomonas sp. DP8Y7-3]MBY5968097.1 GNAT family N-acetyltransferase [Halomonas denitrificans]MBY5983590.1 GNAT family N-acetyltransferase [Halomonas sp. DP5Y7-2]MBY6031287.1 GNAT family N-acetyltransferase [Halomonas sp. DP8Y7-1]
MHNDEQPPIPMSGDVLATPRSRLRPFEAYDLPALSRLLADPRVMRYSLGGVCDVARSQAFIEACRQTYRQKGFGYWAVVHPVSRALMGFCGFDHETLDGEQELAIGYRYAVRHWGRGLATEVARAVVTHAFTVTDSESLVAVIDPANVPSTRVAQHAGFQWEGMTTLQGQRVKVYRRHRYRDVRSC